MAMGDLVRLADVKAWLSISDTSSDALLSSWITRASRWVVTYLDRGPTLAFRQIIEIRDGNNNCALPLRYWPVLSVSSLSINGITYAKQTDVPFGMGFFVDQWTGSDTQGHQYISNVGTVFYRDRQNVTIIYNAGYQIQGESHLLDTTGLVSTAQYWYSDQGVTYANGTVLTYIATGTPGVGQYTINSTTGQYTFAVADAGQTILITYSYTPDDLVQAVIGVISWQWKQKDRIGVLSKTLGGQETMAFSQLSGDSMTMSMLQHYKNIIPL